jgi:toxin ParE1/3/4
MISPVTHRPQARVDLLEQFVWFGERSGVDLAERYFAAVEATCQRLASFPHSGTPYEAVRADLIGLRKSTISGFEDFLIFYLAREGGIDVVRVVHGARDLKEFFAEENSNG